MGKLGSFLNTVATKNADRVVATTAKEREEKAQSAIPAVKAAQAMQRVLPVKAFFLFCIISPFTINISINILYIKKKPKSIIKKYKLKKLLTNRLRCCII